MRALENIGRIVIRASALFMFCVAIVRAELEQDDIERLNLHGSAYGHYMIFSGGIDIPVPPVLLQIHGAVVLFVLVGFITDIINSCF